MHAVGSATIAVLDAGDFRCYIESLKVAGWRPGMMVTIEGTLLLDYYIWSERIIVDHPAAPDLFHSLRVTRIQRAYIPETSILQTERHMSWPTNVPLGEVAAADLQDIDAMLDDRDAVYRPAFFLVDFTDDGIPGREIPRTFR